MWLYPVLAPICARYFVYGIITIRKLIQDKASKVVVVDNPIPLIYVFAAVSRRETLDMTALKLTQPPH